jgi:hypothetical protein
MALEHARIAVRRPDFAVFESVRRPGGVVHPSRAASGGEAADSVDTSSLPDCAQLFAERDFPSPRTR